MFVTFLSRLMASLLTTLLFLAVVGFTANQTLLNTTYLEKTLQSQNAYNRLSDAITIEVSKSADPGQSQEDIAKQLKQVITADVLRDKIHTTLEQLQAYYRGTGPVPTLDLRDLVDKANQAGLPIEGNKFDKPITLTATVKAKKAADTTKLLGIAMFTAILILFLGVVGIAIKRRDYRPLANILFALGFMLTVTGGALLLVPRIFNKMYQFDSVKNPLGTLGHDLAVAAVHDFGLRLLIPGAVILLLGILAKFLVRGKRKSKKAETLLDADEVPIPDSILGDNPAPAAEEPAAPTPAVPPLAPKPAPRPDITPGAPPRPRPAKPPRKIQL